MTKENPIEKAAQLIRASIETGTICQPVRDILGDENIAAGYAVQNYNNSYWLKAGRRVIGRKLALTAKPVQEKMGFTSPAYGMLFADMCLADGAEIDIRNLIQPKLETEIAVVLKHDLNHACNTVLDIIHAIDYCLPAFEIASSRFDWNVKPSEFVADNAAAAYIVLGSQPKMLSDFNPVRCQMTTALHGKQISSGAGSSCLFNPLNALVWLADNLAQNGQPLRAGEVVMTGALGPMIPISSGDNFDGEIEGLGSIRISFCS